MQYIKTIRENMHVILFLAKESLAKIYEGMILGITWSLLKPLIYILIFWFFFLVGIRSSQPVGEHEYLLFLFAGVMPWFYLTDIITNTTRIVFTNNSIIRNFNIPLVVLPISEVLGKFVVHTLTMIFVVVFFMIRGGVEYYPDVYYINFIFYFVTLFFFSTGCAYFLSALAFIIKDVRLFISAIMQGLFWLTPVVWVAQNNVNQIEKLFNPLYFFLEGYRETMLYDVFFFEHMQYNIYIWIIIIFLNYFGIRMWYRLEAVILDNI